MRDYLNFDEKSRNRFWHLQDEIDSYSDFLFARPSFVEGWSRILDIGNTLNDYNYSDTPEETDLRALQADWFTIGNDLRQAILSVLQECLEHNNYDRRKSKAKR